MLLQQNIFMGEIFILHTNYFNDLKSFNFSRGKMTIVRFKDVFFFLLEWPALLLELDLPRLP